MAKKKVVTSTVTETSEMDDMPEADTKTAQPEKKQNALVPILGGLVLLAILALIGFFFYRLGQSKGNATPTPTPTLTTTPEASGDTNIISTPTNTGAVLPTFTPTPQQTATTAPTSSPTNTPTSTPVPKADLYISEYSFDHPPKQGEAFTVKIGIYNKGDAKAGAFWWEWWPTYASSACRVRIDDGINARGGRIVYCTYTYGGWANYVTKAVADANNEVSESDEGNNTFTQNVLVISNP